MKRLILALCATCMFCFYVSAQKFTCTDFGTWPSTLTGSKLSLDPNNPLIIQINAISDAQIKDFLSNSSLQGTYNGEDIDNQLTDSIYSDTTLIMRDDAKKTVVLHISNILSDAKAGDSVVLSLKNKAGGKLITYTLIKSDIRKVISNPPDATLPYMPTAPMDLLASYFSKHYSRLIKTDVGFKQPGDLYTIHIFLDQFGNELYGSIPTGIQRKYQYKVHILYPSNMDNKYFYYITVTGGTLNDNLSVYNINGALPGKEQAAPTKDDLVSNPKINIEEYKFNIFPTSNDLSFDVNLYSIGADGKITPNKLHTYTITKTNYYIGSFNVGIFYTWLTNPTYSLVNSPSIAGAQTVKVTDNSASVNATFMYTVYLSIWNALFPKYGTHGKYNWWGRSYLDDNVNILRKIYPSFGVGFNGTVIDNWFAGFNVEPMQGFGIFFGQNIRKVNTFTMPNFVVGTTDVTQDQFNYYQNTSWKTGWAVGVIIDLSIFSKLSGSVTTPAK